MGNVFRIYVEKKPAHAMEAKGLLTDLKAGLGVSGLTGLRLLNRYDVEGIDRAVFEAARHTVFAEPQVDDIFDEIPEASGCRVLAVEFLPGQFDQRADSCAQCIQLITRKERPLVRNARVYLFEGSISDEEFERIKSYLINPVECREASLERYQTLAQSFEIPDDIPIVAGFIDASDSEIEKMVEKLGLAMDSADLKMCRDYFKNEEKRNPTLTEIRVLDTYWSDHCRHTTFLTNIRNIELGDSFSEEAFAKYLGIRKDYYKDVKRPITLMDLATLAGKWHNRNGLLPDLDESEEINACSVKVKAKIGDKYEDWLLMFKNETHNHPTEIEPFGGAATCLGGAIRDPLSGRAYVYQAMRVTGAADPRTPFDKTLPGKLPQKKITTEAAAGYSSYGNQIGIATGLVDEIYHPNYLAKRMEVGAVIGAAPAENVVRNKPMPGDVVILLGGRTGRDGCGGATGSSKSHTQESLETCGAEVQKGNPPEERKIQRLFRNQKATTMIKRCNDFGAGGVSVAIGELADGLNIDLDAIPRKYEGLDGTELAISESQERMAVIVSANDVDAFCKLADSENLEATPVAVVTQQRRLVMNWRGKKIVDISRDFLSSNGAPKTVDVKASKAGINNLFSPCESADDTKSRFLSILSNLNVCLKKGLVERFDSSIGASSVVLPFGGEYQNTPVQYMAARLPSQGSISKTCSVMTYGFDPYLSEQSPFHGAFFAVLHSTAKLVAAGCSMKNMWFSFQEYFPSTRNDPERFGLVFNALLGAFEAQTRLGLSAIGGKDSMSGSFNDLDVPPTLISFAVSVSDDDKLITPEFKGSGHPVYLLTLPFDKNALPEKLSEKAHFSKISSLIESGKVLSSWAVGFGGVCEAVSKMSAGTPFGFSFEDGVTHSMLFDKLYGSVVLECTGPIDGAKLLGYTNDSGKITFDRTDISKQELLEALFSPLEGIFPTTDRREPQPVQALSYNKRIHISPRHAEAKKPVVAIPVFPGTNCEYDTAARFSEAGASCRILVFKNLTPAHPEESLSELVKLIDSAQILALPGGFSGGDEPDGSGKFIASVFRNPRVSEAVHRLLKQRDGLAIGICNGFQALIKLGLLPYGEIKNLSADDPTLTFNSIGRHQAIMVRTRISSTASPWLSLHQVGDIHLVPVSHGEGRLVAPEGIMNKLAQNGQIATQYVDLDGKPTMEMPYNPNGSMLAAESLLSPDGRVFGKMAHSERLVPGLYKNIPGTKPQLIIEGGVNYFK